MNLIASAPARLAARTVSNAVSRLPLWLADNSAIMKTGALLSIVKICNFHSVINLYRIRLFVLPIIVNPKFSNALTDALFFNHDFTDDVFNTPILLSNPNAPS